MSPARGKPKRAGGRGAARPSASPKPRPKPRRSSVNRPSNTPSAGRRPARGLGGDQVEGRQAVRELLLAGRRRVRELLVSEEPVEGGPEAPSRSGRANESLQDLVDLALDLNVPVREVSRKRLLAEARTDAPQGVVAHA